MNKTDWEIQMYAKRQIFNFSLRSEGMRHRKVMGFIVATAMSLLLVACGSDNKKDVDVGKDVDIVITPGTTTTTMGQPPTTFAVATTNTDYSVSTDKAAAGCVKTNATTVTCTPTAADTYTLTVTATADKNKTKTATLVVNPVIITITPETTTIKAGETATLTLSSGSAEVTWPTVAGGTLTPNADGKSATFTSDTPDTYTITVTAKADNNITKSATVIVKPAEPTVFIKSGETATVEQKKTVRFDAEVSFPAGQPENTPKWAVVGEDCGSVEPSEGAYTVYTAPATPKTCKVTASIVNVEQKTITFEASVTVTPPEEIAGMVYVEPGTFTMGCDVGGTIGTAVWGSTNCQSNARPAHQVTLTQDFYIGKYEVTQEEWLAVVGSIPTQTFPGDKKPVMQVKWDDIQTFIGKLNERDAGTGRIWRLPTEAEWEYAARGGAQSLESRFCGFNDIGLAGDYEWNSSNSGGGTHPVGEKLPNELGIRDMCGNAPEFVEDWYASYGSNESLTDPLRTEPNARRDHVMRGGSYNNLSTIQSVVLRTQTVGEFTTLGGFRLALTKTTPAAPDAEPTSVQSVQSESLLGGVWDSAVSGIKSLWPGTDK
jgi:formylglycine-generating enzyme required for sulfatase activity